MPQIFTPSADTWLRAAALGVVVATVVGCAALGGYVNASWVTRQGWPVAQPVPFSHKHHVTDDGIDCRYCHTTVETSANAGFPSTEVCMTCHSQLWTGAAVLDPVRQSLATGKPLIWHRVAQVPDYVFFNHSIHVNRGVPCEACHGRVDQMPLMQRAHAFKMTFCLDCHKDPAKALRPPEEETRMDWSGWDAVPAHRTYGAERMRELHIDPSRITNCETCHR
jgi:hypothetical protein